MYNTRYSCPILIVPSDVRKILRFPILWKSVQWEPSCSMRVGGRTDGHDETNCRYRKFGKAPKNHISLRNIHWYVFLKEEICVLCEVRIEPLYQTHIHLRLQKVNDWRLNRFLQEGEVLKTKESKLMNNSTYIVQNKLCLEKNFYSRKSK
jgi:hypothetical protein